MLHDGRFKTALRVKSFAVDERTLRAFDFYDGDLFEVMRKSEKEST
jgi:hypothetical protein